MDGVGVARLILGSLCVLGLGLTPPLHAMEPGKSSGAVLSFPKSASDPMPDLAAILVSLKRAGFTLSSASLALVDGREALSTWTEPLTIVGGGTRIPCGKPELSTSSLDPLLSRLGRAETLILKADFAGARALSDEVNTLLPCLTVPVKTEILYRSAFVSGISHYYQGQDEGSKQAAMAGFAQAAAIDPDAEWDRTHPPAAQEVFLRAARQQDRAPKLTFKRAVPDSLEIWLDGRPLAASASVVAPAVHLLQIRSEPGAEVRTWMLDSRAETGKDPVWIADGSMLQHYSELFKNEKEGSPGPLAQEVLFDSIIRWGRQEHHDWLLLAELNQDASLQGFRYINLNTGRSGDPPPELFNPNAAAQVALPPIAGRSGKTIRVPSPLLDWTITAGLQVDRQLVNPKGELGNYIAVEVGGYREIQNKIDARFALNLGRFENKFTSIGLHLGVRKSWQLAPFGFFVEGGLFGCSCWAGSYAAELGFELRGGSGYYFNDPTRQNGLEFYFGPAVLFTKEVLGQFGLAYLRRF